MLIHGEISSKAGVKASYIKRALSVRTVNYIPFFSSSLSTLLNPLPLLKKMLFNAIFIALLASSSLAVPTNHDVSSPTSSNVGRHEPKNYSRATFLTKCWEAKAEIIDLLNAEEKYVAWNTIIAKGDSDRVKNGLSWLNYAIQDWGQNDQTIGYDCFQLLIRNPDVYKKKTRLQIVSKIFSYFQEKSYKEDTPEYEFMLAAVKAEAQPQKEAPVPVIDSISPEDEGHQSVSSNGNNGENAGNVSEAPTGPTDQEGQAGSTSQAQTSQAKTAQTVPKDLTGHEAQAGH